MRTAVREWALLGLRWVALAAMSVWFGGFTFYSAVVIPVLHDAMGGLDAGAVTGEVSNVLNAVGAGTVAAWWVLAAAERGRGGPGARRLRVALLAGTTAVLTGLVALHPALDARLATGPLRRFYPLHQVYLIASTVQWGLNLALIAATLRVWQAPAAVGGPQICTDSPSA